MPWGNALEKGSAVQCSAAQGNTILRSTVLDWRYRKFNVSLQLNEIEETKLFFKNPVTMSEVVSLQSIQQKLQTAASFDRCAFEHPKLERESLLPVSFFQL